MRRRVADSQSMKGSYGSRTASNKDCILFSNLASAQTKVCEDCAQQS